MEKISKKLSKKIMAVMLAVAMAVGVTAGVRVVMDSSFADELGKFDPVFYAAAYPDVAAALGTDANVLYSHYQNYGQKEGRVPYAGAAAGEAVDGIAGTTAATAPAVNPATAPAASGAVTHSTSEARKLWQQGLPHGYQPDYSLYEYTPEQMVLAAQMQQEFDAGGYVHVGWTEEQVYERLMWIKENRYPEGTKVGICDLGAGAILGSLYGGVRKFDAGWDKNWQEELFPAGFVHRINGYMNNGYMPLGGDIRDMIRVGDEIHTKGFSGSGHVSVVLSHDDRGITVVESNINGDEAMHWGDFISWEELENGGNTIYKEQNKLGSIVHYLY